MKLKIISLSIIAILAAVFLINASSEKVYLRKAGADQVDEAIRMHFPALVNHQKSEAEDRSQVSAIQIKYIKVSDTIGMEQSGTLALSGRVAVIEESEIFDITTLKVYMLYGKEDCTDFITRYSQPHKLRHYDILFPKGPAFPRYVNCAVLTVLKPDSKLQSLERGDYLSVLGDWGNVSDEDKRSTSVSQHGVNNFYILLRGYNIKPYESEIFKFQPVNNPRQIRTPLKNAITVQKGPKELILKIDDLSVVTEGDLRTTTLKYTYTLQHNGEVTKGADEKQEVLRVQKSSGCTTYSVVQDKSDQTITISDISLEWSTYSADSIYLHLKGGQRYSVQDKKTVVKL